MPYYLDAPTLAQATAVYTNAALSICAANGVYSDGSITRVQTGCVLGPAKFCPSCGSGCDSSFGELKVAPGVFKTTVDLGNDPGDIGAVIIRFNNVSTNPNGIKAIYDGITYNSFSSPIYGYMTAPADLPVYIGDEDGDCGITSASFILDNNGWDGTDYIYDGTTSVVSVLPTQTNLTVNPPGTCVMVIPKVNLNPSSLDIIVESPCGTAFGFYVTCPTVLFPTYTSQVRPTADSVCQYPDDLIYYNCPVNGNGVTLGLFDWVFIDPNGESVVGDGYYHAPTMLPGPYNWFLVQNGIIIQMGECQYDAFIIERCGDGLTLVANSSIPGIVIGDFVTVSYPSYDGCTFQVVSETFTMPTVTINAISPYESCADACLTYSIDNMTASTQSVSYSDCDGLSQTVSVPAYTIDYVCARVGSVSVTGSPAGVIVSIDSCEC
jgi:hypothetical protein